MKPSSYRIYWVPSGGDTLMSFEGRFTINPIGKGAYRLFDRLGQPGQLILYKGTLSACKRYARDLVLTEIEA